MLEALINYFPVKEQGFAGVGALDYSPQERKKLALLSQKSKCEKCGPLLEILPILKKEEKNEEVKEESKNEKKDCFETTEKKDKHEEREDLKNNEILINELKSLKESLNEQKSKLTFSFKTNINQEKKKQEGLFSEQRATIEKNENDFTFDNGKFWEYFLNLKYFYSINRN